MISDKKLKELGFIEDKEILFDTFNEYIEDTNLKKDLKNGFIAVIAGFQGVDKEGNITTLGRGGSDTTAVALAAALKADECQIYTDVDGIYTTDPRVVPEAKKLKSINFEEMLEMASLGSKVLQTRSVEFAGKYKVKLRVLSSFSPNNEGTEINFEEKKNMEDPIISGIAFNRDEAEVNILGVPDMPGIAYQILGPIAEANIGVDVIIQNLGQDGLTDFTFTVQKNDLNRTLKILNEKVKDHIKAREIKGDEKIAKLSINPINTNPKTIMQISTAKIIPRKLCNKGCLVWAAFLIEPMFAFAQKITNAAKNQYRIITTINTLYSPAR